MSPLALSLAVLVGVTMGALGSGGSLLTVPILVYLVGLEPRAAIVLSLAVVGVVSTLGALQALLAGQMRWRLGLAFASGTMVGTWGGTLVGRRIDQNVQLVLFGAVVLGAAVWMLRRSLRPDGGPACRASWARVLVSGVGVGILTGLVGVGGGFMIVPALVMVNPKLTMQEAAGTSLLVISLSCLVGVLGYLDASLPWMPGVMFAASACLGVVVGGRLARRLRSQTLQRLFAAFLVAVSVFVLARSLPPLLGI